MTDDDGIDEIGPWTEVKLEIIRKYASAYSKILAAQTAPRLTHVYIDAFSGSGLHRSRQTGDLVPGSPSQALQLNPPFAEYHFIDLDQHSMDLLQERIPALAGDRIPADRIHCYNGDCNEVLLTDVFPRVRYEDFRRALCLLDPFGLHLDWKVVAAAGQMRSVELFLNFPIHDVNRNVLPRDRTLAEEAQTARLTKLWGDESWMAVAYSKEENLFGFEMKVDSGRLADAFRDRLRTVAGFPYVPKPVLLRNTKNAPMFYLFFAARKPIASHIIDDIFRKYRSSGR